MKTAADRLIDLAYRYFEALDKLDQEFNPAEAEPLDRTELDAVSAKVQSDQQLLQEALTDYDLRRSRWWGRFLLWLLEKTT